MNQLAPVIDCDDPVDRCEESLLEVVPRDRRVAFEMRKVIKAVFDEGSFFEMGKGYGRLVFPDHWACAAKRADGWGLG